MKDTVWILVANKTQAKIFRTHGPQRHLELLEEIFHPQGRLHGKEFKSDKPGTTFDSTGNHRHSVSKVDEIDEQLSHQFAQLIAKILHTKRSENEFSKLVLVAEPGFLGEIRKAIDTPTSHLVLGTINKNLLECNETEIESYAKEWLQ